jgi:hypothetical protein
LGRVGRGQEDFVEQVVSGGWAEDEHPDQRALPIAELAGADAVFGYQCSTG